MSAEVDVAALAERVDELEQRCRCLEEENEELREENEELREELESERSEREKLEAQVTAVQRKADANADRVAELQSRELEKGAHLDEENVRPERLTVDGDRVELVEKDAGTYARLPGECDPLGRGGETRLDTGDLLPIQQLARLDEGILAREARPVELAARAWDARDDDTGPWSKGCNGVRQYLDASALREWIRVEETGVSAEYAKKLAQRTLDALTDLSQNRCYVEKRKRRKDGLKYKETRLVLPSGAEIPGETTSGADDSPGTGVVAGD